MHRSDSVLLQKMPEVEMTHDELLAKLSVPIILKAGIQETDIVNVDLLIKERQALRAVVELHTAGNGEASRCEACYMGFDCPTIRAIEKELG